MAVGISVASMVYNGAEGGVSIGIGKEHGSNALVAFGIQSLIEVVSASLVVWRFAKVAPPGQEASTTLTSDVLRKERVSTVAIGALLGALSVGTLALSVKTLAKHEEPDTSLPGLIISASALGLMVLIWAPKPWLAKRLNSSAMSGEAKCSLACISMTAVLLGGTLISTVWKGGWWLDSATAIVLAAFFGREAFVMTRWGLSKDFSGGCCESCPPVEVPVVGTMTPSTSVPELATAV